MHTGRVCAYDHLIIYLTQPCKKREVDLYIPVRLAPRSETPSASKSNNDEPVNGQGDIVSIPFGIDQPVIVTVQTAFLFLSVFLKSGR